MWTVTIIGSPAPKGSMKPFLDRMGRPRVHEDESASLRSWRKLVAQAGEQIAFEAAGALREGPVVVDVTITLQRPKTAAGRLWPVLRSPGHGDTDKLARTILDALTDSGVITDDAQVVDLHARKAYTVTPGMPGVLDRPGAVLTLSKITIQEHLL